MPAISLVQITEASASARQYGVKGLQQGGFIHRLGQVVLGTLSLAPDLIGFLILGGHNDHRNVTGFRIFGQLAGRLKTVQPRHDDIHQHRVGLFLAGDRYTVSAILGLEDDMTVLFQHGGQLVHFSRRVINNQNASHDFSRGKASTAHRAELQDICSTGAKSGTCALIAPSNSSLLNGLVRYWSDPTMRPLALSNRPSLDDSMITGVDLKELLFLISAQV